jgi:hypothetical protein
MARRKGLIEKDECIHFANMAADAIRERLPRLPQRILAAVAGTQTAAQAFGAADDAVRVFLTEISEVFNDEAQAIGEANEVSV